LNMYSERERASERDGWREGESEIERERERELASELARESGGGGRGRERERDGERQREGGSQRARERERGERMSVREERTGACPRCSRAPPIRRTAPALEPPQKLTKWLQFLNLPFPLFPGTCQRSERCEEKLALHWNPRRLWARCPCTGVSYERGAPINGFR
jgi:hypothetical protein